MQRVWLALLAAVAVADDVTVVRLQLSLEEEHTLQVDHTVEYILQFVPTLEQSEFPSRVWVRSSGGDVASPLLLTARQRTGARTWQLPYYSGQTLLYELERMLCPEDSADIEPSDCAESAGGERRGEFSLHVGSACEAPFAVTLRAAAVRDWALATHQPTHLALSQAAPRVHYFRFAEGQDSVRLVLRSEDDVCATVAVQAYSCPIKETLDDIQVSTMWMTMQRSGGAQVSKLRYPRGFYVIGVIGDSDAACTGEDAAAGEGEGEERDWLWEQAVWGAAPRPAPPAAARLKHLSLHLEESLSRAQYAVGTSVVAAVFLAFYVVFGALVLAERWPRWHRLVAPRAVLADSTPEGGRDSTLTGVESGAGEDARARRRDSGATFDSSDNSDTDSEDDGATTATATTTAGPATPHVMAPAPAPAPHVMSSAPAPAPYVMSPVPEPTHVGPDLPPDCTISTIQLQNDVTRADILEGDETQRPFGLPAQLRVAALSRRRGRVLRARSDRYLHTLYTVAVFYALPVVQFVAAFQMIMNVSGSLDLCYYNFLCAHPLGALADFNHVFSNLGYLLLGALFVLQEYGIPQHYGLLSSLGAAMMVVALLSASYHVCPNSLNFQFDTAFMYVLAVLSMVKIYQSRHPDINARAHATFAVLAVLILLVVWGVLGGGPLFWSVFTVVHVFTFLLLSLQIYYVGQFRLEKQSLAETARSFRASGVRPLYTPRLVALLIANAVNWAFALYGLVTQTADIASHLLGVLLCNALLYMVFYLSMKLLHGERPRWYSWLALGGAACAWAPALYWFAAGSTDWASAPAQSRHLNHECRVLRFYDSHDLWHMLSAVALYLTFNAMLTWDDGLSAVKRTDIAVF